jgi:DHA1 family bicyclomycin/chloramphenicol resistance-like MFS transporter
VASVKNKKLLILMLGSLTTLSPFAIDLYLPAFPQIAASLGTTASRMALTLSSYFIGLAIGQIFYGPLLDRFGRKRPLYFGLAAFIVASFGCMQTTSVEMLILCRFLQALGGCVAQVSCMAMVRDFFPPKEGAKVFSLLMLILSVSPLLAPTFGGFLATTLGWPSIFVFLAVVSALMLAMAYFFLPEGHKPDASISLKFMPILRTYWHILKEPQFYAYALSGALAFSGLFAYIAGSPTIFMDIFKVSAHMYGAIFAGLSVGVIGASQVNIFLMKKFRSEQIFQAALMSQALVGGIFFAGAWFNLYGLFGTLILLFLFLAGLGLTYPNAASLALAPFSKNAGSASALLGFMQIGCGALTSAGVGLLNPGMISVAAIMGGGSLLGATVLVLGKRGIAHEVEVELQ